MAMKIVSLSGPGSGDAPFRFKKGDKVAWKRSDGSADIEFSGVIVDGLCEYLPGGGAYRDSLWLSAQMAFTLVPATST